MHLTAEIKGDEPERGKSGWPLEVGAIGEVPSVAYVLALSNAGFGAGHRSLMPIV